MKNLFAATFLFFTLLLSSQTTINGSFVHGGINRSYSFYVPASYTAGQPVPLVLNLHGYTSNGAAQAIYGDFRPIADTANFIVAHPDGTIDPFTMQRFWNFGIFGTSVDDVGFLQALIDTISAHYSINQSRVYCTGMSNGSFMCYALACQTNRFAAIGPVTGSMSVPMYNSCNPSHPTPVIHIHGTADSINPYAGNSTSKSISDVVQFWRTNNSCGTTPAITAVPDTDPADNTTSERYLYSGGINGHTVEHFKVSGGGHTWPGSIINLTSNGNTSHDFSASKEIWRFFSQYSYNPAVSVTTIDEVQLNVWPNPATEILYIEVGSNTVKEITLTDMQGRVVLKEAAEHISTINVNGLSEGFYLAKISGADFSVLKKVIVSR